MTKSLPVLTGTILMLLPAVHGADTFNDFDNPGTPGVFFQTGAGAGPTIVNEAGFGNFLRLLNEVGGESNHYSLDATHDANWSTLVGQFDFRFRNTTGVPADGVGFLLIPQSTYGATGAGPTNFVAEEPNLPNTLGLGLDVYSAVNDVSVHWNGFEQTNAYTAPAQVDFMSGAWNRARVTYTQVGNGLNATVEITKDVFGTPVTLTRINQAIDARPYANRAQFSGRTGGSDMGADLDNILVNYTGTANALPTLNAAGRVWQDFESLGATGYVAQLHTPADDSLRLGPKLVATGGSGGGAYMQLMPDGQNSTISSIALNRTIDAAIAPARRIEMDFRMANPDNQTAADGMGLLLLPTATYGVAGGGPAIAYEDANVANALGVGLRVFDGGTVNRVQLHWNNARVAELNLSTDTLNLQDGSWHRLQLETEVAAGGSNVTLSIVKDVNGAAVTVPIFANQFVPGLTPYDYRLQTGARSGGLNVQADVDNLRSFKKQSSYAEVNNTTFQNFDGPGTDYQAWDVHGVQFGNGTRHAAIVPGGPSGNFLRLAHAVNEQNPNIGFEQVIPSGAPKPRVEASFAFRMTGQAVGTERADGFGFGLFGVSTYGTSGPITEGAQNWENPTFPNALTMGVRIYDGDAGSSTDYLTFKYNGLDLVSGDTNSIPGLWDLNDDRFHAVKLTLEDIGTDTKASLELTQDVFGLTPTTLPLVTDFTIFGLDLDTFDFRAGLGVRTGGLNADFDFDNVVVVPEPGSAALLLAGLAGLVARRRRSA